MRPDQPKRPLAQGESVEEGDTLVTGKDGEAHVQMVRSLEGGDRSQALVLGRAGGELFLMKRVNRDRFEQMRDRFAKQEFLAMMVPSILPPPTPWKLFVFAAGVFEMRVLPFMTSVFVGRVIRDMITAILTIKYGPEIVNIVTKVATEHKAALLIGLTVLVLGLIYWAWRKIWRKRNVVVEGV